MNAYQCHFSTIFPCGNLESILNNQNWYCYNLIVPPLGSQEEKQDWKFEWELFVESGSKRTKKIHEMSQQHHLANFIWALLLMKPENIIKYIVGDVIQIISSTSKSKTISIRQFLLLMEFSINLCRKKRWKIMLKVVSSVYFTSKHRK